MVERRWEGGGRGERRTCVNMTKTHGPMGTRTPSPLFLPYKQYTVSNHPTVTHYTASGPPLQQTNTITFSVAIVQPQNSTQWVWTWETLPDSHTVLTNLLGKQLTAEREVWGIQSRYVGSSQSDCTAWLFKTTSRYKNEIIAKTAG